MKTRKIMETLVVAVISTALAAPALGVEPNIIDVKAIETQIVSAQGQIVQGNLDAGLKALREAQAKAITPALAARSKFVVKLAEIRMADKLGDQAKVLATLQEAFKQAKQPDQFEAVWRLGSTLAQAAAAGKDTAGSIIDFLAKGPGPAMHQFGPHMEVAKFRIATRDAGAAEAELRAAAQRTKSQADWSAWLAGVGQLAAMVDGGQAPKAGADVFDRLREAGKPVAAALNVAKGRFLLGRGLPAGVAALIDEAVTGATSDGQVLAALALGYDLARAFKQGGKGDQAKQALAKAECLAQSRPVSAAVAQLRGAALRAFGQPEKAAEVFWAAAQAVKADQERELMFSAYGAAMVAAGNTANIVPQLQAAKAGPAVFVSVAQSLAGSGDPVQALDVLGAVPAQAAVGDPRVASGITAVMQQIQAGHKQVAAKQAAMCRTIAATFDAAAKKAEAAKDAKRAGGLAKQAAAFGALATQVQK